MSQLIISSVTYLSDSDEDAFFGWLKSIPGVLDVIGKGRDLIVSLDGSALSDPALRELLALHRRYGLPMGPLAQFETQDNSSWFRAPGSYWHSGVFGT